MIPSPPSMLAEQLRAARELFEEALHKGALVVDVDPTTLDTQLLALASSPTQPSLLAWARTFRGACIGAQPLVSGQPTPAEPHIEVAARATALELELEGDFLGAVFVLGAMLRHQQRIEAEEVEELQRGPEPTTEALRTVLGTWIQRGAAWGGPMLAWMRDLHARLDARAGEGGGEPQ